MDDDTHPVGPGGLTVDDAVEMRYSEDDDWRPSRVLWAWPDILLVAAAGPGLPDRHYMERDVGTLVRRPDASVRERGR